MVSLTYLGIHLGFHSSEALETSKDNKCKKYHNIRSIQSKNRYFTVDDFIKKIASKKGLQDKRVFIKEKKDSISSLKLNEVSGKNRKKIISNKQKINLQKKKKKSSKKKEHHSSNHLKELSLFSEESNDESIEMQPDPIIASPSFTKSEVDKRTYLPISAHAKRIIMPEEYSLGQILKTRKKKKMLKIPDDNSVFDGFEDNDNSFNSFQTYGKLLFKSSDEISYDIKKANCNGMQESYDSEIIHVHEESEKQKLSHFIPKKLDLYNFENSFHLQNYNYYPFNHSELMLKMDTFILNHQEVNKNILSNNDCRGLFSSLNIPLGNSDSKNLLKAAKNLKNSSLNRYLLKHSAFDKNSLVPDKAYNINDIMVGNTEEHFYSSMFAKSCPVSNNYIDDISDMKKELFLSNTKKIKKLDTIKKYDNSINSIDLYSDYKKIDICESFNTDTDLFRSLNKKKLSFFKSKNYEIYVNETNCYDDSLVTSEKCHLFESSSRNSKLLTSNDMANNEYKPNITLIDKYTQADKKDMLSKSESSESMDSISITDKPLSSFQSSFNCNNVENYSKKYFSKDSKKTFSNKDFQNYKKKNQSSMKNLSIINESFIRSKQHSKRSNTTFELSSVPKNSLFNFIRQKTANISDYNHSFTDSSFISKSIISKSQLLNKSFFRDKVTENNSQNINDSSNKYALLVNNNYEVSRNSFLEIREAW
ncbi:hypothetical protein PNEG_00284 [Pneumocystis murina B123]|uniref:Uncharacterized protein n=1 Tax=Pneumocystis murina (strain B123) TaxID=1069680 RepID=M7NRB4_PNEMU|nr:hypothetical protein PNEG_00284 [Pneumocystis murina B123]EMR11253.1 hypothetical protein PNEG_00284 [Pneumocystis murina B123]